MNTSSAQSAFELALSDKEFHLIADLIYKNFGIHLPDIKKGLVLSRLRKIVANLNFSTFEQYHQYLLTDKTGQGLSDLVNKISTNFTYFYREEKHFEYLQTTLLPRFEKQNRDHKIRIWCAGCSSGEEPYMLSMILHDYFKARYNSWDAGVLATDISQDVLSVAKEGIYEAQSLDKLPTQYKHYFQIKGDMAYVDKKIKDDITFRRFNLMNEKFPFKGKFHIIFCRNVMIYFDKETKDNLISRFTDFLLPGGHLFIGHAESIDRGTNKLNYVQPAIYSKKEGGGFE